MAHKHLRELLSEDQEPFLLSSYIADRKSKLARPTKAGRLIKPAPKSSPTFSGGFCKSVCLFSVLPDSPDYRRSPLFDFAAASAYASPHKSPNRILLHVPAKTAALLLEAAVRIQQKSASPVKPKPVKKGLFGSILKRLTLRNREAPKRAIESERRRSFGAARGGSADVQLRSAVKKSTSPGRCRSHSRRSSGLWSESNGERSLDLETSTSGSDSVELVPEEEEEDVYAAFDEGFCGSPFRFVLRRSPSSSGDRTPDFPSPAASPTRHRHGKEGTDYRDVESSKRQTAEVEEHEKEQCSPVSVLDPLFEDGHDQEEEEDGFDYECSFANVQRAKQQLLEKLCRFEKLAGLDPVELEKRIHELDGDDDVDGNDGYISRVEDEEDSEEPETLDEEFSADRLVKEVLKSKFDNVKKIPNDMKRLVSDLVAEEWGRWNELGVTLTRRVCDRFDSWKRVDANTIDMMVEKDFSRDLEGWSWKHNEDQVAEVASRIEIAVFRLLVEELLEDLF